MIAEGLDIPLSEVYGVASFYAQFSHQPQGPVQISVCLGTACYVKGAARTWPTDWRRTLGIRPPAPVHPRRPLLPGRLPLRGRLRSGPGHDGGLRIVAGASPPTRLVPS